ncbi:hypothetical protein [Hephaestia mangrovi]|uniref:hypothetical protein n=1 Tax=Hephaestia mangrovi TaxID=2873268 RepID=UPI002106CBAC|nr:hypothetical protein [Hephaestia mangrovi]
MGFEPRIAGSAGDRDKVGGTAVCRPDDALAADEQHGILSRRWRRNLGCCATADQPRDRRGQWLPEQQKRRRRPARDAQRGGGIASLQRIDQMAEPPRRPKRPHTLVEGGHRMWRNSDDCRPLALGGGHHPVRVDRRQAVRDRTAMLAIEIHRPRQQPISAARQ